MLIEHRTLRGCRPVQLLWWSTTVTKDCYRDRTDDDSTM